MLTSRSASRTAAVSFAVATAALLAACGSMHKPASTFSQASLPAPIQVPAGNKVAWETVGSGDITYECRDKANAPGQTEWVFVGPDAVLKDRMGKQVGRYYGPPQPGRPTTAPNSPPPSWLWRRPAQAICLTSW